jgi:archaellum component FlaC
MAENTEAILAAISALDSKVDGVRHDIAGLKKTDEHLASEVHRIGEEQRRHGRELQELRAETLRTFESERHASQQTVQAITKHVDEASQAFHAKAADIDTIKAETLGQTEMLKAIVGSPTVRKVGAALATFAVIALGYAGMKLQASVQKLEEKPTTVQAAPTVYLPVYVPVDGGTK